MFCPVCKDEFRAGFTRCGACNVDLVDSLSGSAATLLEESPKEETAAGQPALVSMMEYCGFLTLNEARDARGRLKEKSIRSEILIRETSDSSGEEYWLRVERDRYREVFALLGFDEHEPNTYDDTFSCAECGNEVAAAESFCSKCGARFEDD
jgi:hypothetical protein